MIAGLRKSLTLADGEMSFPDLRLPLVKKVFLLWLVFLALQEMVVYALLFRSFVSNIIFLGW